MNDSELQKNKLGIDAIAAFFEQFGNCKDEDVRNFLLVLFDIMLENQQNDIPVSNPPRQEGV